MEVNSSIHCLSNFSQVHHFIDYLFCISMTTEMDTSCTNFHFIVANSMTRVQCAGRASLDRTQPETQQTETSLPPLHRPHPHRLHQMPVHPVMRTVPATRKYSVILTSHQTHLHIGKTQALFPAERLCKIGHCKSGRT